MNRLGLEVGLRSGMLFEVHTFVEREAASCELILLSQP